MKFRPLGQTDMELPVISFGAWAVGGWMWGGSDDEEAVRALHAAVDHGIACIDTAPAYGMGHSEVIVGKALAARRDKVLIATKCGLRWDLAEGEHVFDTTDNDGVARSLYRNLRPHSIRTECEESLRRMRTDYIDLYQCHWPDTTTPIADTMDALMQLQREGKIRAFGVSNFTVDMMRECLRYGRIESDQPRYNALDRAIETEILPFCRDNDIGVLAYCPLEQGLLTGKVGPDRIFNEGDQRCDKTLFSKENRIKILDMLDSVRHIAEAHGATLGQLFLAWVVAQPGITTALAGTRSESQAIENAAAGEIVLSDEEAATIRDAVEQLTLTR